MAYMDAGNYDMYRKVVISSIASSRRAFAPTAADADVDAEMSSLQDLADTVNDRAQDRMSRKKLSYRSYDLSRSRRESK